MAKTVKIVARSIKIDIVGDISRCNVGEDSKFYCLPVKITFDNGKVVDYTLKAHGEPKTLKDYIENKKGIKDKMDRNFGLTEDGKVLYIEYLPLE